MKWVKEIQELIRTEDAISLDYRLCEIVENIQQEIWDEARSRYTNKAHQFNSILRPDSNGQPDDIVIDCDWIHLEQMDHHWWWMGIYRGNKRVTLNIGGRGGSSEGVDVFVRVEEDQFGLVDDAPNSPLRGKGP